MNAGARTPEELEMLLEDGLIARDREALVALFDTEAVLVSGKERALRGPSDIVRLGLEQWRDGRIYVADPKFVVQARDIALVLSERGVNVVRRSAGGAWHYVIVVLADDDPAEKEEV
jgi:hypothetical protein